MFKIVVFFAILATAAAQRYGHHGQTHGFARASSPVRATSDDVHAEIISAKSDVRSDGFDYQIETSNAIRSQASGDAYGNVHGDFEWVSPEGEHIAVGYVADENGYQPNSAALPTPPPIPAAILKAIRYIETHPQKNEEYKPKKQGRRF